MSHNFFKMYKIIFIFLFTPFFFFAQNNDYKSYDKAVKYFNQGHHKKTKEILNKIIDQNPVWRQPNLLLASLYIKEDSIEQAVSYYLNTYDVNDVADIGGIQKIAKLLYENGFYTKSLYYLEKIIEHGIDSNKLDYNIKRFADNCRFAITALEAPFDIESKNMGKHINSSMSEYVNTITVGGEKLFFTRMVDARSGYIPQEDFYISELDSNSKWKSAEPLKFNTIMNEGAISVSSDGALYVYTACDRSRSYGGCDLFIREYSEKFGWSNEYNLGENINTQYWESQPCFSVDGKYLYFVSNRPGGLGKSDIYRARIVDKDFVDVENLGDKINTSYNEMSPFLHPDNLTLYFASTGHIGMGDYDLFVSRRKNVDDKWYDAENMGYPINTFKSENSLIVARDGKTAYYSSDKDGFGKEDIFTFQLPEIMQANTVDDIELDILKSGYGKEIVLNNVHFSNNSFSLSDNSFIELNKLIVYLLKNPSIKISIEGHTDNIGDLNKNMILSNNRAKTVYNYLLENGVDKKQLLSYEGFGELSPISNNDNIVGRKLNRRTSFRIIE